MVIGVVDCVLGGGDAVAIGSRDSYLFGGDHGIRLKITGILELEGRCFKRSIKSTLKDSSSICKELVIPRYLS